MFHTGASFFVSTQSPPSPHPYPPDTFTQMTTVPNLCTPVELHRHPESRRLVSKMCKSETSQATSQSKKVRTPQTMGITGHLGKLYGLPLIAQKKMHRKIGVCRIFFVLLQKVL